MVIQAQCYGKCRTLFHDADLEWDGLNYSQPCPTPSCGGTVYPVREGTYEEESSYDPYA